MAGKKYKLKTPITSSDKEIKEVEVHPLKGKDMVAAEDEMITISGKDFSQAGTMKRTLYLIARSTRLPVSDVEEMDADDIVGLQDFLSSSPTSGQ